MTNTDDLIKSHLSAAADLVQRVLKESAAEDPDGVAILRGVIKAGGMLALHSTFAPAAGMARLVIEVIEPNGNAHQLMACELQREPTQ